MRNANFAVPRPSSLVPLPSSLVPRPSVLTKALAHVHNSVDSVHNFERIRQNLVHSAEPDSPSSSATAAPARS
jgi:hypothetical protein